MTDSTNPTNIHTIPSVSISTARSGVSSRANALGMRAMQERAYAKRGEQYLLIKARRSAFVKPTGMFAPWFA